MDILAAVFQAKEVRELVDPETLGDALGTIELDAARDALQMTEITNDRSAQLWSVITHLQTAEAATNNALKNPYNMFVDWTVYANLCD
jgi:hypothetical protein